MHSFRCDIDDIFHDIVQGLFYNSYKHSSSMIIVRKFCNNLHLYDCDSLIEINYAIVRTKNVFYNN